MTILQRLKSLNKLGVYEANLAKLLGVSKQYLHATRKKAPEKYETLLTKAIAKLKKIVAEV